ncbi:cytoplasmic tRNA 2-thiolation protein 2-like isoform X1 [Ostrea edulis]|uniref:cytoplasmic tRNA 2-thiolation protein 2-like isoform X1 n=1 Tax=Ostrea edulis TaxID=37623 RepID=UPI0024AEBB03|nr:cytoplasmic tRNA 2-thiolation protein 2-like isoform X1 [Ostrea edulis]
MCSVQEGEEISPVRREKIVEERKCMKCEKKAVLVTRVNDAFCRECFMVYVTHKFRAAIGKSKLIRDGETVLVGVSGGQASSCLLHLIQEGLGGRAHKKLRFKPGLVFIDEGVTVGMSAEERLTTCSQVLEIMEKTGFPCYVRALEQAMELDKESIQNSSQHSVPVSTEPDSVSEVSSNSSGNLTKYDEAEEKLKVLLNSLKSVSAKEDLIKSLRQNILIDLARKEGYTKVMLGDCSTRLAVRLLTDIAQGRGAHVAMDTAFADTRCHEITLVRPIRDFSSKEVTLYNILNNVPSVFIPTITTKAPDSVSIEHLTEKFVTGLQAEYPSTTSNIMRTGEKLHTEKKKDNENQCTICQAPLDTDVPLSSALGAVQFSETVSRCSSVSLSICNSETECCGRGDESCQSNVPKLSRDDVIMTLCYACRLLIKDLDDVNRLPNHILEDITKRHRRIKMKSEIKDFLLDSADSKLE